MVELAALHGLGHSQHPQAVAGRQLLLWGQEHRTAPLTAGEGSPPILIASLDPSLSPCPCDLPSASRVPISPFPVSLELHTHFLGFPLPRLKLTFLRPPSAEGLRLRYGVSAPGLELPHCQGMKEAWAGGRGHTEA